MVMRLPVLSCCFILLVSTDLAWAQPKTYEVGQDGVTIDGTLGKDDPRLAALKGAPYQGFAVKLKKGQSYVIELKSKDFDAYLIIERNGKAVAHDDDSGGGLDSRVIFEAPEDDVYQALAASFDRKLGRFQLNVREKVVIAKEKLADEVKRLVAEGTALQQKGDVDAAIRAFREAYELRKEMYPVSQYPKGHANLAANLRQLGVLLTNRNQFAAAQQYLEQGLAMLRQLYPATDYPHGHRDLADSLIALANLFDSRGQYPTAQLYSEQALEMAKKLYPADQYPQGHEYLARSLNYLGSVILKRGNLDEAQPYLEQSLAMKQKLYPAEQYPNGHAEIATSLGNVGILFRLRGQYEAARPYYEQALEMGKRLYPATQYPRGHHDVARSYHNMAALFTSLGQYERAQFNAEQALAMWRSLYPESQYSMGHPDIVSTLNTLSVVTAFQGRYDSAQRYGEEALRMAKALYPASQNPRGHPFLVDGLVNLAGFLRDQGKYDAARAYQEQAIEMSRQLYPASQYPMGHPVIAMGLSNLGGLDRLQGKYAAAQEFEEQALEMYRKLYPVTRFPQGHPDLATSLDRLGTIQKWRRQYEEAKRNFEQALKMTNDFYPPSRYPLGHPFVAATLNNLAGVCNAQGQYEEAQKYYEQSLAMAQKLYPESQYRDGHPHLASSFGNLASVLQDLGQTESAQSYYEKSLSMSQKLTVRFLAMATESEALEFIAQRPIRYDAYLSLTRQLSGSDDLAHAATWTSRHVVTRLMEQRHASARAAGAAHLETLAQLRANRRRTEGLLQDSRMKPADRAQLLDKLGRDRETLERDLVKALPILEHWKERDRWTPKDLAKALPAGAVLIEVTRYIRMEQDPDVKGTAGETQTFSYVAFILSAGKSSVRVELGAARPLDESASKWLKSIDTLRDAEAPPELVDAWAKIAKHLPDSTRMLYITPDGLLATIPWAALPGRKPGTVLLEQFEGGMATVPHGLFLLEALKQPVRNGQGDLVAIGDVDFGKGDWPALPGTATELKAIAPLAPGKTTTITGKAATPVRLAKELPAASFAHFATHGFFDEKELTEQKKRELKLQESRGFGEFGVAKVAWKNPAAFTGLVLSGGEVMTGLALVDLPLENLQLVTLSACETGLGELTAGEGVQGLQRAFHVAGCPNVVASLWKVNDAATAALMTKFYHELWVNKKPPIEALRTAQLTIYRSNPEQIAAMAGLRGRPKLEEAIRVEPPAAQPKAEASGRTPTRLWASFVFSGAGR